MFSARKMITARVDCHCKSLNSLEAQPSITGFLADTVYDATRAPAETQQLSSKDCMYLRPVFPVNPSFN